MRPSLTAFAKRGQILTLSVGLALLSALLIVAGHLILGSEALELAGVAGLVLTCVGTAVLSYRQAGSLEAMARTDPLTGLANHRGFHEALRSELARARRQGGEVSLVSLDLDDFKAVNDTYGHPYGDEVLRGIGAELKRSVREFDTAARVGGEEFALILPDTPSDAAHEVAERARAAIARVPVDQLELSCSAGIASFPADADDASTLWHLADAALYSAKSAGKRRTRRFDPGRMERTLGERQVEEVRGVLSDPEGIRPVFQPVVALSTGFLVGYEALARFPASGARPVPAWFAMAHGCGLGPALEAAAIRAALEPIGRPPGTHLALNVSPSVLMSAPVQEALPEDLTEIVIEITEHETLVEDAAVRGALGDLRRRGARIAVDDAGAGYSGLQQLLQVEPDIVKLDRVLIEGVQEDPARLALIESFVRFARRTGAVVCAEGIASLDELSALADLDVELGQGFALGKPGPPWPEVPAHAARVCRAGVEEAMRPLPAVQERIVAGDRGLERLSAQLAGAQVRRDLEEVLPLLTAQLNADEVSVARYHPGPNLLETLAESVKHERSEWDLGEYPLSAKVLRSQESVQVMVGDPEAEPSEVELLLSFGYGSLLLVPIVRAGESVGLIEAYSKAQRAWARTEINRARIICNQFASLIENLAPDPGREDLSSG